MKKYQFYSLLFLFSVLMSCTNEDNLDVPGTNADKILVRLSIPDAETTEIATRAVVGGIDDCYIRELYVVVFRNGKSVYQKITYSDIISNRTATPSFWLDLNTLRPKAGEKITFICNPKSDAESIIKATASEKELQEKLTISGLSEGYIPMHGSMIFGIDNERPDVELKRSVACIGINNLLAESVFKTMGNSYIYYHSASKGYLMSDKKDELFIPSDATHSSMAASTITKNPEYIFLCEADCTAADFFILIQGTYNGPEGPRKGYYKIKLYDKATDTYLNLHRNHKYMVNITKVSSYGYETYLIADKAPASNIEYSIEDTDLSYTDMLSNGQYAMSTSADEVHVTPTDGNFTSSFKVKTIVPSSVDLSEMPSGFSSIKIYDTDGNDVTSSSSSPIKITSSPTLPLGGGEVTVSFQTSGAQFDGYELEVNFGNLSKRIPIHINTANCYRIWIGGYSDTMIPVIQANADGVTRIKPTDTVTPEIVWSDLPDLHQLVSLKYDKEKGWIQVTCKTSTLPGNMVIAAKVNGEVKWSWHLWFTLWDDNKYYDQPAELVHGYKWMIENLGASGGNDNEENMLRRIGCYYQWGRKDPFIGPSSLSAYQPSPRKRYNKNGTQENGIPFLLSEPSSGNNLELSIQKPGTLIYTHESSSSTLKGDWYGPSTQINDNRWGGEAGASKSPYDPCPIGWRVPPMASGYNSEAASPFYGLTSTNYIWTEEYKEGGTDMPGFTIGSAFFPSGGESYINENAGTIYFMSLQTAYYWYATARIWPYSCSSAITGKSANINADRGVRSLLRLVRCIKDE